MRTSTLLLVLTSLACAGTPNARAAEPFIPSGPMVRIWPGEAPGSEGNTAPERWVDNGKDSFHRVTDIHAPTVTVYLPQKDKATGAAFVIAPGGGHRYLVVDLEGEFVAKKLNAMGIAAFVLRSRLEKAEGSTYHADVESLADVLQAIRVVRSRAKEWSVDPAKVGVMGFSAGGHLAALAQNNFDEATRPNFVVLGYPAYIDGTTPIAKNAPPAFMFVNDDDNLATKDGEYYLALRKAKIPVEFHVFRRGGHGTGATGRTPDFGQLGVSHWPDLLGVWLKDMGML